VTWLPYPAEVGGPFGNEEANRRSARRSPRGREPVAGIEQFLRRLLPTSGRFGFARHDARRVLAAFEKAQGLRAVSGSALVPETALVPWARVEPEGRPLWQTHDRDGALAGGKANDDRRA
jgi:hypothetical protein